MKKFLLSAACLAAAALSVHADEADYAKVIPIYDGVTFYDGYSGLNVNPDAEADDGILRHSNAHYATRLTDEILNQIGKHLSVSIRVEACCDNYDRIGNINLALVPKGEETYDPYQTQRLELGRFITPFMNKNWKPNVVPYSYWMDYLSPILRNKSLRENYDLWLEFELFGIPYAANTQVVGCAGRSDTFKGYLDFLTDEQPAQQIETNVVVPVAMKIPEHKGKNLNNYSASCTDILGQTIKTYTFEVPVDVNDAQIVLITSNHGANENGEEYNRRWHFVDYDGVQVLSYRPGRTSCEPFRKYNTQPNGIYNGNGSLDYRYDSDWQSFSNWCPGDVIDNRIINLGPVKAGTHTLTIEVPDAVFNGNQGDIPVSFFFQGATEGMIPTPGNALIDEIEARLDAAFTYTLNGSVLTINAPNGLVSVEIHDARGRCLRRQYTNEAINTAAYAPGTYLITVETPDGLLTTRKIAIK